MEANKEIEKKGRGRPRGSANKRSLAVAEKLKELDCDPLEGMAKIAQQAMDEGDMALAGSMYKELAQYVAPKRKAVEVAADITQHSAEEATDNDLLHIARGGGKGAAEKAVCSALTDPLH